LPKFPKEQENTKPMSLLRFWKTGLFTATLLTVFATKAVAELYGFYPYNPLSKAERNLAQSNIPLNIQNYRAAMRDNLLMLIRYAKKHNPDFKIVAHEGQDLLTKSQWEYDREGYNRARLQEDASDDSFLFHKDFYERDPDRYTPAYDYLNSLDAIALNNLYCGAGHESPVTKKHNLGLITLEYCSTDEAAASALLNTMVDKKISYIFTDLERAFNNTDDKDSLNDSSKNIFQISDAQNILILTDDHRYATPKQLTSELLETNYDIIIMRPLFDNHQRFEAEDLNRLHFKKNGSKRLLLAELNVSEASPREYYWLKDWQLGSPVWLVRPSFTSADGIITAYWNPDWQQILSKYFRDIMNEGFDGVFLTGLENYRYFEQLSPLE
jgi:cysteinyl-tRNA synthetase